MKTIHQPVDVLVSRDEPERATLRKYIIGFSSSIVLTLCAYLIARGNLFSRPLMVTVLALLALTQFIVQLVYFLHAGREFSPRLKQLVMFFMIVIVVILVGGSIWIMNSLSGRMMNSKQMIQYMNNQDNL